MELKMTEDEVRNYVTLNNKEADDCIEYLNGLANEDGTYDQKYVESFLNR